MRGVALIASAALAFEDVMHEIGSDEHLQLLQMSARRHEETQPFDASNFGDGGPYEVLGFNQECPDESQLLTLRQCAEAVWSGKVPNVNRIGSSTLYGPISQADGPRGCWYAKTREVYYNANPTGSPHRNRKPICGVNGGRLAETQLNEAKLPVGGVELRPVNTVCDECGILTNEQCHMAGAQLGIPSITIGKFGIYQSNQNGTKLGGNGPAGCYRVGQQLYYNFDTPAERDWNVPHGKRQPICGVCPTTTTPAPTPPAPPPAVEEPGDHAEAVGDPHITTITNRHFDMER